MPPTVAHPGPATPLPDFARNQKKRQEERLPPLAAVLVILALSALGWIGVIHAARMLRAALIG